MVSQPKFSPILSKAKLLAAMTYTHRACFALLKSRFGRYLPVAGNIGIFCHSIDEYRFLTELRREMTDASDNWNNKYFHLHEPVAMPADDEMPQTIYTYLYIRKPDQHTEVGDVDFVLDPKAYSKLKKSLTGGEKIEGLEIMERPDLDLIRVFDPAVDVLSFIGRKNMAENLKVSRSRRDRPRV